MSCTGNIVSRQQWGAATPKKEKTLGSPAKRVVIHHTALQSCTSLSECMASLISIQKNHMTERDFDDIGYNFLVGGDGHVFQGRGWGVVGAHAKGHNNDSLGIAFMGNFNDETPSREAIQSVKELLKSGVSQGLLVPQFDLFGHKDLRPTECPGTNLHAVLHQLRKRLYSCHSLSEVSLTAEGAIRWEETNRFSSLGVQNDLTLKL